MCKWYCMSEGPNTNLNCLHCGCRYCAACLNGEAGKMTSLIKCASCGKKPRTKSTNNSKPNTPTAGSRPSISKADRDGIINALKGGHLSSRPSTSAGGHSRSHSFGSSRGAPKNNNVFSRLCDTTAYPGTHKHRFDESGRGRGLYGRESIPKGNSYLSTPNALEIYRQARYQME